MKRPPRPRSSPILTTALVWHVVLVAGLFMVAVFGVFNHVIDRGDRLELAQTMAMNTLVVLEIFHLFFIRNLHGRSFDLKILWATPVVWTVVLIVTAAQLIVTQSPPFQRLLGTEGVSVLDCLLILAVGAGFFVVIETEKRIRRSLKRRLDCVSWRNRSAQA